VLWEWSRHGVLMCLDSVRVDCRYITHVSRRLR